MTHIVRHAPSSPNAFTHAVLAQCLVDEEHVRVIAPAGPERGELLGVLIDRARKHFHARDIEPLGRKPGQGPTIRIGRTMVEWLTPAEEAELSVRDVEAVGEP